MLKRCGFLGQRIPGAYPLKAKTWKARRILALRPLCWTHWESFGVDSLSENSGPRRKRTAQMRFCWLPHSQRIPNGGQNVESKTILTLTFLGRSGSLTPGWYYVSDRKVLNSFSYLADVRFSLPAHTQRIPNGGGNLESTTILALRLPCSVPLGRFWSVFTFREQ